MNQPQHYLYPVIPRLSREQIAINNFTFSFNNYVDFLLYEQGIHHIQLECKSNLSHKSGKSIQSDISVISSSKVNTVEIFYSDPSTSEDEDDEYLNIIHPQPYFPSYLKLTYQQKVNWLLFEHYESCGVPPWRLERG